MEDKNSVVHVLVAPSEWKDDLRYRRHRLTEHLLQQSTTQGIAWVCPGIIYSHTRISELPNGVLELVFPEIIPRVGSVMYFCRPLHRWLAGYISRFLMKYPSTKKVLWFTYPAFPGLIDIQAWDTVVYDCSDYWGSPWSDRSSLQAIIQQLYLRSREQAENYILKKSGIIFTTSDFLNEKLASRTSSPVFVVENGVEFDKFYHALPAQNLEPVPRPRLGFVGGMKPKIDFLLLYEIARQYRDWSLVLIGPIERYMPAIGEFRGLVKEENVYWIPGIKPDEVPAYLKELDVGLMPYKELEYNKAVFSLKLFEYLASGLPVVGCGLPSTEKYARDKIYIHTQSEPQQFAAACKKAISWTEDKEAKLSRINLAKEADWHTKFDFMVGTVLRTAEQRHR